MGLIRLFFLWFIGASVLYLMIAIYSRSVRRERLETEWAEAHPDGGDGAEREAFIEGGMADYQASFRPKLIALVYVVPLIAIITIHISTTYF